MIKIAGTILFSLGFLGIAFAESSALHVGTLKTNLKTLYAIHENEARAPSYDQLCQDKFNRYKNRSFFVSYSINTQTLKEDATAMFSGYSIKLMPMGLTGQYAFLSDGVSGLEALQVGAAINTSFTELKGSILFKYDDQINCVLES